MWLEHDRTYVTRQLSTGPGCTLRRLSPSKESYAIPHNVIRILGASPDGEVWSVNPRFVVKGVLGGAAAVEDAEAMETICAGVAALNAGLVLPTLPRQALSHALSITGIRMEAISDEGLLIGAA